MNLDILFKIKILKSQDIATYLMTDEEFLEWLINIYEPGKPTNLWDKAYNEGYRDGRDEGYDDGWDAAKDACCD